MSRPAKTRGTRNRRKLSPENRRVVGAIKAALANPRPIDPPPAPATVEPAFDRIAFADRLTIVLHKCRTVDMAIGGQALPDRRETDAIRTVTDEIETELRALLDTLGHGEVDA